MKVLIINNYLNNTLGGVENYLDTLVSYAEENKTQITFKWFGVLKTETKFYQKIYNAQTTRAIIKEIDLFKPDIIHCFSIGATVTPHFMRYAKSKSIPIVQSFRDYYYICPKTYMLDEKGNVLQEHDSLLDCVFHHHPRRNIVFDSLLYLKQSIHKKIINRNIDYYLTPSENLTKLIGTKFKSKGKTLPNPLLINNPFLKTEESNYLLFVGRLAKEKGVLTLIKSFQKILEKHPNEQLKIVGTGSYKIELEKFIIKNNIQNIEILGSKNRDELAQLYAKAKFTIVPSEILESYGNVILESFAFNKTVIISDLLGIKNEVISSKSGLVFPHGNVLKLTETIEKLLVDEEYKKQLEENASKYVKAFSFENHFKQLEELYNTVLNNKY